jgi:hypothetical protein
MNGTIDRRAVRGAVEDFAAEQGLTISVTYQDQKWVSWWLQKPTKPECVKNE